MRSIKPWLRPLLALAGVACLPLCLLSGCAQESPPQKAEKPAATAPKAEKKAPEKKAPEPVKKAEVVKPKKADTGGGAAVPAASAKPTGVAALGGQKPKSKIPTLVAPGPMAGGSVPAADAAAAMAGAKRSKAQSIRARKTRRKGGKKAPKKATVAAKKKSDDDLPLSMRIAVAKAAPKLPEAPKSFDEADVGRVVRQHQSDIKYCYEQAVRRVAGLGGKLVAEVTIQPDGHVSKAKFIEDSVRDRAVTRCVKRRVMRWQFETFAGKPETVSVPFLFEATN